MAGEQVAVANSRQAQQKPHDTTCSLDARSSRHALCCTSATPVSNRYNPLPNQVRPPVGDVLRQVELPEGREQPFHPLLKPLRRPRVPRCRHDCHVNVAAGRRRRAQDARHCPGGATGAGLTCGASQNSSHQLRAMRPQLLLPLPPFGAPAHERDDVADHLVVMLYVGAICIQRAVRVKGDEFQQLCRGVHLGGGGRGGGAGRRLIAAIHRVANITQPGWSGVILPSIRPPAITNWPRPIEQHPFPAAAGAAHKTCAAANKHAPLPTHAPAQC